MNKKGFSIVEAVVAVNLAALMIVFLIGIIPYCIVSLKRTAHFLVASSLAEQLMENIRMAPFDSIPPQGTYSVNPPALGSLPNPYPNTAITVKSDGVTDTRLYSFTVDINDGVDPFGNTVSDIKRVTVTVTWTERTGVTGVTANRSSLLSSEILRQVGN